MQSEYQSLCLTEDIGKVMILFRDKGQVGYSIG